MMKQMINSIPNDELLASSPTCHKPMLAEVFSTQDIQNFVCQSEVLKFNIPCENVKYLFSDWEIDVCSLNKNGYLTEFEVKISRSDFKADSKKKKWHWYNMRIDEMTSNYFYYVCQDELISENEIPNFAGLIYMSKNRLKVVKKAPLLHKFKHDKDKIMLKFLRVMSERKYLGSCRLTYENSKRISC